jgi:hypothetical protein
LIAVTLAAASLAQAQSDVATETASALVTVPALTPVIVRIDDEISSRANKSGDRFKITVAEDVRVGDTVVIPAGSVGEGEVIHAAKRGAGGKAGELIVMARYVRVDDNEIRLRSFALGAAGADKSVDSLAASLVFGPFGLIQKGGDAYIYRESLGMAKTALEFKLPAVVAPAPVPAPQPQSVETKVGGDDESKSD